MKATLSVGLLCSTLWLCPQAVLGGGTVTAPSEANLRAALMGGGYVTFACDGTIPLTGTLEIGNDTTLDAKGHSIVISGNGAVRVFVVVAGATLGLRGLTIADGTAGA